MSTKRIWSPNAVPTLHLVDVSFTNLVRGDVIAITLNNKTITYQSANGTLADMAAGLVQAWQAAPYGEMKRITAGLAFTVDGDSTTPANGLRLSSGNGPFTVTAVLQGQGTGSFINVTETTAGVANSHNAIQSIVVPRATGGTFTLTCGANTTAALNYFAGPADIQSALCGLASIGANNCTVTGAGVFNNPFVVTFVNGKAGTAMPQITGSGTNLAGVATAYATLVTEGNSSTNQVETLDLSVWHGALTYLLFPGIAGLTQKLDFRTLTTAAEWQVYLNTFYINQFSALAIDGTKVTNFVVTDFVYGSHVTWQMEGSFSGANWPSWIEQDYLSGETVGVSQTLVNGAGGGQSEIQQINISGATGGTFTIAFSQGGTAVTTGAIAFDADAPTIQTALQGLSNIGFGNCSVTSAAGGGFNVSFAGGTLANMSLPLLSLSGNGLTGGTLVTNVLQVGSNTSASEVQTITLGNSNGGTFTLAWGGYSTAAVSYNASASTVQSALQSLASIGASNLTVSGSAGGPYTLTFAGTLANAPQALVTANASQLTSPATEIIATHVHQLGTGPNFWADANNWADSSGSPGVPANGDDVFIQDSDVDILYTLNQSGVVLNSLNIDSTYTGQIGLPHYNSDGNFVEYNPLYLAIGAADVEIGRGNDNGSSLIKIDSGGNQVTLRVDNSGTSADGLPAVQWKGTHASNKVYLSKGDFGAAVLASEVATIAELDVGFKTNQQNDVSFLLGEGCTTTTIKKVGGSGLVYGAVTTIVNRGGDLDIVQRNASTITQLTHDDGTCSYQGTGTITEADIAGVLDFRQDLRPRTITTLNLYAGAEYHDPCGTVSVTNPIKFVETNPGPSGVVFDVPQNITLVMVVLN